MGHGHFRRLIQAFADLARKLEIEPVVEGIETERAAAFPVGYRLRHRAGVSLQRPRGAPEIVQWMHEQAEQPAGGEDRVQISGKKSLFFLMTMREVAELMGMVMTVDAHLMIGRDPPFSHGVDGIRGFTEKVDIV